MHLYIYMYMYVYEKVEYRGINYHMNVFCIQYTTEYIETFAKGDIYTSMNITVCLSLTR